MPAVEAFPCLDRLERLEAWSLRVEGAFLWLAVQSTVLLLWWLARGGAS